MKPAAFNYHDPDTVDEAVKLLGSLEDSKVLAGGQSLVPMLNMRFVQPSNVIDLNKITSLTGIEETAEGVRIGAMTRQRDLMKSRLLKKRMPILAEALHWVGHFQTRNRGTIGGSLCHLDPAAELPAIAALYDAEITVAGPRGSRVIPFSEWPLAYMMPSMAPDELATEVHFKLPNSSHGHAFVEYARRHGDFAIVAVGALLMLKDDGSVQSASISIGGADQVVRRVPAAETALVGKPAELKAWALAAETAAAEIETMGDTYASAEYRSRLIKVLVERALTQAAARAGVLE